SAAKEGKDAVVRIVAVDPFEAAPVEIHLMERWFGGVQTVEVRDEAVNALVQIELEQVPVEAASLAPFGALRDFVPHEEPLLDGIGGKIIQRVVHPAHVPFQAEAEATEIGGTRNAGPGGGLFGDGEDAGEAAVRDLVEALEEGDGVKIFAAAERIRHPFSRLAR